jgi:LytS/YehU family sensor histidine kinase
MALFYPWLQKIVAWLVDRVILQRPDYDRLKAALTQAIAHEEDANKVLTLTAQLLAPALNARAIRFWKITDPQQQQNVGQTKFFINRADPLFPQLQNFWAELTDPPLTLTAVVVIPTAMLPRYFLGIGELLGGHRLLSDEITLLETIALLVAKHIDTVSVNHERCEMNLREQEISKLATEAELRTLRAQINPHFLFNALTTIGYLIQAAPDRALETLMRLTGLLRGILRRSEGEFATLGEELDIIRAYLDIEQARFEERLRVKIDVPDNLFSLRIPALLVQPLVENAVKHGITPLRQGGEVGLTASLAPDISGSWLNIMVTDNGKGLDNNNLIANRQRGVGLNNIERRLRCHYGEQAAMNISGQLGEGTTVKLTLPVTNKTGSLDGRSLDASLSPAMRSVAK